MAKERCWTCSGTGRVRESYTEQELDHGTSIALGAAFGSGYFPSYKTVTKYRDVTCSWCHGSGER